MRVLYIGDIHGDLSIVLNYIRTYSIKDVSIIQLGDFGIGFLNFERDSKWLESYNSEFAKNGVTLYVLRGNHDYKSYFDNDPFGYSNIKLMPDYSVLKTDSGNILFLGGAISIDRKLRYNKAQSLGDFSNEGPGLSWWSNEEFVLDCDRLAKLRDINIVVSHTAPSYCQPDNSFGFGPNVETMVSHTKDYRLKYDLTVERAAMSDAFEIIKLNNYIKYHYYGHFHISDATSKDGTVHRALGINEIWEEKDDYYNNC